MAGGCVAVVTSASAAMGDVRALTTYQAVKREMVSWWRQNREVFADMQVNLMLINMGFINTDIWNRAPFHRAHARVVGLFIPKPERYTKRILQDAAKGKAVSYPGRGAKLAPLSEAGVYEPNGFIRSLTTNAMRAWFTLWPTRN